MVRPRRLFFILGGFLGIAFVAFKVVENVRLQASRNPAALLDLLPQAALQVNNFHRSMVENGRKVWEVSGDEAVYLKEDARAVIQRPKVIFYQDNGDVIHARSREGQLFLADGDIERIQLQGDVEVLYRDLQFQTEKLIYLYGKDRVISPGRITLTLDGAKVEGTGMEMSISEERMELQRQVRTTIYPQMLRGGSTSRRWNGDRELRG